MKRRKRHPQAKRDRVIWMWHLRKVRIELGLSLKQAAKLIGVSDQVIYRWEHSINLPLYPRITRYNEALRRIRERNGGNKSRRDFLVAVYYKGGESICLDWREKLKDCSGHTQSTH